MCQLRPKIDYSVWQMGAEAVAPNNPGQDIGIFCQKIPPKLMMPGVTQNKPEIHWEITLLEPRNAAPSRMCHLRPKIDYSVWRTGAETVAPNNPGQGIGFFAKKSLQN